MSNKKCNIVVIRQLVKHIGVCTINVTRLKVTGDYQKISLHLLYLVLKESARLFNLLLRVRKKSILFDGGEDWGANIYTRMKLIRDICSASEYGLRLLVESSSKKPVGGQPYKHGDVFTPREAFWISAIRNEVRHVNKNELIEIARVIDDVLGAIIEIVNVVNLAIRKQRYNSFFWQEVLRNIQHVRDHFDYAELYLINSLKNSNK